MRRQRKFGISTLLVICMMLCLIEGMVAQQVPPDSLEIGNTYVYKVKTGTLLDRSATITYWELSLTDVSGPFLADRYTYQRGEDTESAVEHDVDISFLIYDSTELAALASNANTTEVTKLYGTVERSVYEYTQNATNDDSKIFVDINSGLILEKVENWNTDNPTRYLLVSWKEEDMVYEFGEIHIVPGFPVVLLAILSISAIIVIIKNHQRIKFN